MSICLSADGEGERFDLYGLGVVTVLNEQAGYIFFVLHKGAHREKCSSFQRMTRRSGLEWMKSTPGKILISCGWR